MSQYANVPIMNTEKPILWNRNFVQCCISYFLMNFSFYLLMPTMPLYLVEVLGIDTANVGIVLSSYTVGLLCVRPFSGFLVDCFSRKPLYLLAFFVFAVMFGGYLVAATMLTIMAVRFVQGGFMGLTSVSGNTIAIDVIPSARRGEGMGFYGLTINLAMSLAPLVAVVIYDKWGFHPLVLVGLVAAFIGVCLPDPLSEAGENAASSFFPGSFYSGEGVAGCVGLYPGGDTLRDDYLFCRFIWERDRGGQSRLLLYLYGGWRGDVASDIRPSGRSWQDPLGFGLFVRLSVGDVRCVCNRSSSCGFLCLRFDDRDRLWSGSACLPMPFCQCRSA